MTSSHRTNTDTRVVRAEFANKKSNT